MFIRSAIEDLIICIFLLSLMFIVEIDAYEYNWELDETIEGQESATVIDPIEVTILDQKIEVADHSPSIELMRKYSVHLTADWSREDAYKLLQMFRSVPQRHNNPWTDVNEVFDSLWHISYSNIHNDIDILHIGDVKEITVAADAFTYANPLLAEIEGVQGKFFSKRLHRAVIRYVTDNGRDMHAVKNILRERYAVSIDIPNYTELTKDTTGEHADRFSQFKYEELLYIISMLEEYPSGMIKMPGLKYLVRRLDGTPHPIHATAAAVAWTSAGYIEFMESAFRQTSIHDIFRLVLHEKAHFLWEYLFDDKLKQDWIDLGQWYKNDEDEWVTSNQTEFVSAYAHAHNPNEDMAESISYYIVNPDKLRSRSPSKYQFIQDRVMHGTRYISRIRPDLTFRVYNLYPDYIYPGRIKRIHIQVQGAPKEEKLITIEVEIHKESDLDSGTGISLRMLSEIATYFDMFLHPIDDNGNRVSSSHVFRGTSKMSKYAASGYWGGVTMTVADMNGNARYHGSNDFQWKLYINNSLADKTAPQYVPNSMRLTLTDAYTNQGEHYQILTVTFEIIEDVSMVGGRVLVQIIDDKVESYSIGGGAKYNHETGKATMSTNIPNYYVTGIYTVVRIYMQDEAGNTNNMYFTDKTEPPATIFIKTTNPDTTPPELDVNQIFVKAEPTKPDNPDGETIVSIEFKFKDDISGVTGGNIILRDPQGIEHRGWWFFIHHNEGIYLDTDPNIYKTYKGTYKLPKGSVPGLWGITSMRMADAAGNWSHDDFTEIVRFQLLDGSKTTDINKDGVVNILDLVLVANAFGTDDNDTDINKDGVVNILDLVLVANAFGETQ